MSYDPKAPDTKLFRSTHQVGGIRTGTLDHPDTLGRTGSRIAFFNTGGGLRFTVALDRGADIVEAMFNQYSLAYLSPNGYKPPEHVYNEFDNWLASWPAGMVTTCGPISLGKPGEAIPGQRGVHGHFSNTPASVESIVNADPQRGVYDMSLTAVIAETRMFNPHVEVRRTISCRLGDNAVRLRDEVTNRGNETTPHHYLYHCNFGYPLLMPGTRLIAKGKATHNWQRPGPKRMEADQKRTSEWKTFTGALDAHQGSGEQGIVMDPAPDSDGVSHVGLYNEAIRLAVELSFPAADLPHLANWQHLGPRGSYVTGVEPYYGALVANEEADYTRTRLEPGQSRSYDLTIRVHEGDDAKTFAEKYDGTITVG